MYLYLLIPDYDFCFGCIVLLVLWGAHHRILKVTGDVANTATIFEISPDIIFDPLDE